MDKVHNGELLHEQVFFRVTEFIREQAVLKCSRCGDAIGEGFNVEFLVQADADVDAEGGAPAGAPYQQSFALCRRCYERRCHGAIHRTMQALLDECEHEDGL